MWSRGRSVSFLSFSPAFLEKIKGRAGWEGSRGRCHPASRVLPPAPSCSWGGQGPARHLSRLPGPLGRATRLEGARPGGRGAGPSEPGARSSREARWPHVTPPQLVLEQWLPLALKSRRPSATSTRLLLLRCLPPPPPRAAPSSTGSIAAERAGRGRPES